MQLHLDKNETAEYARIREKFFGQQKRLTINEKTEADPDFQRYLVLNRKMIRFYRIYRALMKASAHDYRRFQRIVEIKTGGQWISGISPGYGLDLL